MSSRLAIVFDSAVCPYVVRRIGFLQFSSKKNRCDTLSLHFFVLVVTKCLVVKLLIIFVVKKDCTLCTTLSFF